MKIHLTHEKLRTQPESRWSHKFLKHFLCKVPSLLVLFPEKSSSLSFSKLKYLPSPLTETAVLCLVPTSCAVVQKRAPGRNLRWARGLSHLLSFSKTLKSCVQYPNKFNLYFLFYFLIIYDGWPSPRLISTSSKNESPGNCYLFKTEDVTAEVYANRMIQLRWEIWWCLREMMFQKQILWESKNVCKPAHSRGVGFNKNGNFLYSLRVKIRCK